MQVADPYFYQALLDSGSVIGVILLSSLGIFASRVRDVYKEIGVGTRRALIAYGASGIAMAIATLVGETESLRFLITGAGALFLGSIVIAELWILFPEKRAKQGTYLTLILIVGTVFNNYLEAFYGFPLYFMMVALTLLLVASVYFSVVLVRENPSTFSASLLIVLLLYMATWVIGATYWTFNNPQYYVIQVIPLIVAATIFSSIRKPWRTTLAVFIMLFAFTVCSPLLTTALGSGEWTIFTFVAVELFTAICLIAPLNYFLDQARETGAKTPLYLSAVVTFVSLLVSTHALSWTVFIRSGLVWNQYLVWMDVVIGACAITAFMLAAVSSLYGEWIQIFTREALIVFGTGAAFLTFPLTQPAFITNDMIWIAIGVVIAIGTLMFIRLSIRITRAGGGTTARRLMMFIVSALMIALVSMYSDNIPPLPPDIPVVVLLLLIFAGSLALVSSPPVTARLTRTIEKLDELSELGVEEDGSIRIE